MNAPDVLRYGHLTLLRTLEPVSAGLIDRPGACGTWSIREIVAHLSSYELVLVDVLANANGTGPSPMLDRFVSQGGAFNDAEVEARAGSTLPDLLGEIDAAHARTLELAAALDPARFRESGSIPWYGEEYALDDLIVYQYYGHKREHSAQIEAFRDAVTRQAPPD
jgi:hypothetical protein